MKHMKNDEIRIAIAESRGWTIREGYASKGGQLFSLAGRFLYPESLDACREFENKIPIDQHQRYCELLSILTFDPKDVTDFPGCTASAIIRCQAYLSIINKWKD